MNPDSFTAARLRAGLSRAGLGHLAAIVGARRLAPHGDDVGLLRQDLRDYIELVELGEPVELAANHPYWDWYAQALGVSVLQLLDEPWLVSVVGPAQHERTRSPRRGG